VRVEKSYSFTVPQETEKLRVDKFLANNIQGLSRSALTGDLCEIYVNGNQADKSTKVSPGDSVQLFYAADVFDSVEPQDLPLDILYEDKSILVINKAQGMVVHPGAGNPNGTVVNALAYRYGQSFIDSMADECDVSRPGIVHRLDKDTSGVMVIALNAQAHSNLSMQFQNRETVKYYYAICEGFFERKSGVVEFNIGRDIHDRKLFAEASFGGKYSKSEYVVCKQYDNFALVKVRIFTGRTHQIRIHMKSIGHPVIGDVLYNPRYNRMPVTLMLHSAHLEITHPETSEKMVFDAPLPQRFTDLINELCNDLSNDLS